MLSLNVYMLAKTTRRPWKNRERAAVLRFHRYLGALSQHGHRGMGWDLPEDYARRLFRDGGIGLRELREAESATDRRRSTKKLEDEAASAASLKKWRVRETKRLESWKPPVRGSYLRRPPVDPAD